MRKEQVTLAERRITLGMSELARLFGRSNGAIDYWTKHKGLPRRPDGQYDVASVFLWWQEYQKSQRPRNVAQLERFLSGP